MLEWIKQFVVIPLSFLATVATIAWLAVELLTLTTWGLIVKTRRAAHAYYRIVARPKDNEIPTKTIVIAAAVVLAAYLMARKGQNK